MRRSSARSISPASGARDPGQHLEERRLAAAVRADQPDARARGDDEVEVVDQPPAAARHRQPLRDQEPAGPALRRREVDGRRGRERARARVLQLLDEASGLLDAALRLRRAGLGPPAEPLDLAPHGVGERVLIGRLAAQELVAALQELAVPPLGLEEAVGIDAIELEHARGDVLEEVAIVADHEKRARAPPSGAPRARGCPSTSRWLVGSSIRRMSGAAASSRAIASRFFQPPDKRVDDRAPVREAGAAQRVREATGPVSLVHAGQHRRHDLVDGSTGGKHGVLRDIADTNAAAERARAAVGRRVAGEDLQQGGLAGAIGADETGLVAFEQSERQTVEERPGPVGLGDVLTAQQERAGHPPHFFFFGFFFSFRIPVPFAMRSPPLLGLCRDRRCRDYRRTGAVSRRVGLADGRAVPSSDTNSALRPRRVSMTCATSREEPRRVRPAPGAIEMGGPKWPPMDLSLRPIRASNRLARRPGPPSGRRPRAWCGACRAARAPGRAARGASSGGCPT